MENVYSEYLKLDNEGIFVILNEQANKFYVSRTHSKSLLDSIRFYVLGYNNVSKLINEINSELFLYSLTSKDELTMLNSINEFEFNEGLQILEFAIEHYYESKGFKCINSNKPLDSYFKAQYEKNRHSIKIDTFLSSSKNILNYKFIDYMLNVKNMKKINHLQIENESLNEILSKRELEIRELNHENHKLISELSESNKYKMILDYVKNEIEKLDRYDV